MGGLDPGGGAGLVRDHLTGRALGAQIVLVGTAFTQQSPTGVSGIDPRAADRLQQDLAGVLAAAAGRAVAVKIGMVANEAQAAALLVALAGFGGAVVFDPVLAASSGGRLFAGEPARLLPLLARATLVTPNLAEAAAFTALPVRDAGEAVAAARALVGLGARAALVKGGHLPDRADDVLVGPAGPGGALPEQVFTGARIPGPGARGTGCALATAIAVGLASGRPLAGAVAAARSWLRERLAATHDAGGEHHL